MGRGGEGEHLKAASYSCLLSGKSPIVYWKVLLMNICWPALTAAGTRREPHACQYRWVKTGIILFPGLSVIACLTLYALLYLLQSPRCRRAGRSPCSCCPVSHCPLHPI